MNSRRATSAWTTLALAIGLTAATVSSRAAGVASSNDYSLDYAVVSSGGGEATSADYSSVTVLTTEGLVEEIASSTDYGTTPLIGTNEVIVPVTLSGFAIE